MSETDPSGKPVHVPRPERIRAAVLFPIGGADIREQTVRIDHVPSPPILGGEPVFALHSATGICIATCSHPVPLSAYAFNNGALRVVHNYDLGHAE